MPLFAILQSHSVTSSKPHSVSASSIPDNWRRQWNCCYTWCKVISTNFLSKIISFLTPRCSLQRTWHSNISINFGMNIESYSGMVKKLQRQRVKEGVKIFEILCIIMYHNNITSLIHFHFLQHFIVS
jgi:hypothetical protein